MNLANTVASSTEFQNSARGDEAQASLGPSEKQELLAKFKQPFNPALINWVLKATKSGPRGKQGLVLPYADSRAYTDRLDELVTTSGWTDEYSVQVVEGFARKRRGADEALPSAKVLVVCRLTIFGLGMHSGTGECWADEDNVLTSADAQAFKRACSDFGIGRYLYDIDGQWVDLDEHERPAWSPCLPEWAIPKRQRLTTGSCSGSAQSRAVKTQTEPTGEKAIAAEGTSSPIAPTTGAMDDEELECELRRLAAEVGNRLAAAVVADVRGVSPVTEQQVPFMPIPELVANFGRGERVAVRDKLVIVKRGVDRLKAAIASVGLSKYTKICAELACPGGIGDIPDIKTLAILVRKLEEVANPKKETVATRQEEKTDDSGAKGNRQQPPAPDDQKRIILEDRAETNQADLTDLRNQLVSLVRNRAAESNKSVGDVVAWASNGVLHYPDIGRLTSADAATLKSAISKLQSATVLSNAQTQAS
jgi:Rad52/22 family double-strand break repair protein